jgi:N-acetylneuraminate synthase
MTEFIADVGSNHNNSIDRIEQLIKSAKEIGCSAVKFQLFKADKLYAPQFRNKIENLRIWELKEFMIPKIRELCNKYEIKFGCTPFYLEAVDVLRDYVDYFKIGSYEATWLDLIQKCADTNIEPLHISIGMCGEKEIRKIIDCVPLDIKIVLYHCNSNYPAKPINCSLHKIKTLYEFIDGDLDKIGWSDHTVRPETICKAIGNGAKVIEFHLDLDDMLGVESKMCHVWPVSKIKKVIEFNSIETNNIDPFTETRKWRTDPSDGMRPLKKYRDELCGEIIL